MTSFVFYQKLPGSREGEGEEREGLAAVVHDLFSFLETERRGLGRAHR